MFPCKWSLLNYCGFCLSPLCPGGCFCAWKQHLVYRWAPVLLTRVCKVGIWKISNNKVVFPISVWCFEWESLGNLLPLFNINILYCFFTLLGNPQSMNNLLWPSLPNIRCVNNVMLSSFMFCSEVSTDETIWCSEVNSQR